MPSLLKFGFLIKYDDFSLNPLNSVFGPALVEVLVLLLN